MAISSLLFLCQHVPYDVDAVGDWYCQNYKLGWLTSKIGVKIMREAIKIISNDDMYDLYSPFMRLVSSNKIYSYGGKKSCMNRYGSKGTGKVYN